MSIEQVQEIIQTPSLDSLAGKSEETIRIENEFLSEWVIQMEALSERNNEHMALFCESDKGFKSILEKYTIS